MALKVETEHGVKRQDMLNVHPEDIQAVDTENGRAFPHSDEAIRRRAQSLLDHGQIEPVTVRRVEGNKMKLVAGFLRHKAATLINEEGLTGTARPEADEPFTLKALVRDGNDREALINNIVENLERKEVTALDMAYNARRLKENYGWTDEQIAELFGCQVSYVSRLRRLLQLDDKVQKAVHEGSLAATTAMDMADLSAEEQHTALEEATQGNGKVASSIVKEKVREKRQKTGKGLTRSIRDIRKFCEDTRDKHAEDKPLADFLQSLEDFADGKKGEQALFNAIQRLRSEVPA